MGQTRTGAWLPMALLTALFAAGCGSDPAPVEAAAAEPAVIDATTPLGEIPREQLYGASRLETLWSPRVELEILDLPRGWDGARIAVLGDFQLGLWEENERVAAAAVQRALDSGAELIVLLGDYVAQAEAVASLGRLLAPLREQRTVAVLGDRDIRTDSLEARVTRALQASGIPILRNSAIPLALRGDTIWIAGLDPDILARSFADQQFIAATLGETNRTPILLTHFPALATRAPEGRFPVVLAANTFCGDVEIPGTPRLSWLQNEIFPGGRIEGLDRLFRVQGGTVFVTCGTGYGFVPLRFGAPPEVPIVTLRRVGTPAPESVSGVVEDSLIQRFQGEQPDTL